MGKLKLDMEHVETIKWLFKNTCLIDREIANIFGVSRKHINSMRNGQRWKNDIREQTNRNIEQELIRRTCLHR